MSITQKLANFAAKTRFEDLPRDVVWESKRILLDCIGCGLAGFGTEKGKIAIGMASRFDQTEEATVFGIGRRCSPLGASFANAELMNAMDYEVLCGGHIPAMVVASLLALAEATQAKGKELIQAIAIAHEIAIRLGAALAGVQKGELSKVGLPPVTGWNHAIFGGTAGVGTLLHLNKNQMANAFGIAGYMVPAQAVKKFATTLPISKVKYAPVGWINQAELTAGYQAQMGGTGDISVLDGESGFWKYIGANTWSPAVVTKDLGQKWRFPSFVTYKVYPCCGVFSGALDCFRRIIDENHLQPNDIDEVKVYLDPRCEEPVWHNNKIRNEIEAQFSVAFNFAVAAEGVNIGLEWQNSRTYKNPKILDFMKKVSFTVHPDYDRIVENNPTAKPNRVDVISRGGIFIREQNYPKGASVSKQSRITNRELVTKFQNNAKGILPSLKIDKIAKAVLSLEKSNDVSVLMELVAT